jgi:hypothetical protein
MNRRSLIIFAAWAGLAPQPALALINAYTDRKSYVAGDAIQFHVSVTAPPYSITILRDGLVPQTIASVSGISGSFHAFPSDGYLGANWPVGYTWVVPADWPTGSYFARFTDAANQTHFHPFAIRHPTPGTHGRIAFCMDYNTRNAYNAWGGKSLYVGSPNATRVSFLRPMSDDSGKGKGAWLTVLCHGFLESEGFAVEYITESDIHQNPALLQSYDIVVFSAHIEYNTREFYDAIQAHHDRGGHLAFFSANDLWWQVRYEDNGNMMVGYKSTAIPNDPMYGVNNALVTTHWYEPILNRPGEALQGISFTNYSGYYLSENFTVRDADHWFFAGTGLQNGQVVGQNLAGGETDFIGRASPPVVDILLAAKLNRRNAVPGTAPQPFDSVGAIYYEDSPAYGFPNGRGGQVFAAGCQGFCTAMQASRPDHPVFRQMFRNLFNHMLASPPPRLKSPAPPGGLQPGARLPIPEGTPAQE